MRLRTFSFVVSLLSIILNSTQADATAAKLKLEEINSIAQQTTVLIAPRITQQDLQNLIQNQPKSDGSNWGVGSGVIVGKQGKTYYVLTVAHNFNNQRLNENQPYGLVTSDRQVHILQQLNDIPNSGDCPKSYEELMRSRAETSALVRFGCFNGNLYGIDLAIVTFESNTNYPVASIGDANQLQEEETLYISGWPQLEDTPKLNADGSVVLDIQGNVVCNGMAPRRQRRLAWGPLKGKIDFSEQEYGYSLFYVDNTQKGMSGGPVFNSFGQVVGVHGLGSQNKPKCGQAYSSTVLESSLIESEDSSQYLQTLKTIYSGAQSINDSQQLISQASLRFSLRLGFPSLALIQAGLNPIDPQQIQGGMTTMGRLELDLQEGSYSDPNDVIEDIYKIFSFNLRSMLRDQPSGGCGSLLLGEPCDSFW